VSVRTIIGKAMVDLGSTGKSNVWVSNVGNVVPVHIEKFERPSVQTATGHDNIKIYSDN
jgi:hypothetical protein